MIDTFKVVLDDYASPMVPLTRELAPGTAIAYTVSTDVTAVQSVETVSGRLSRIWGIYVMPSLAKAEARADAWAVRLPALGALRIVRITIDPLAAMQILRGHVAEDVTP